MAERVLLSDKLVKALRPTDKRYDVCDALVPGLLACVQPSGTVTLQLRTRIGANSPIRRAIGQYGRVTVEQARRTAREWLELLQRGINPRVEQRRLQDEMRRTASTTFSAVLDQFCVRKLKMQRRGHIVERIIRRELVPPWRNRPLVEIDHRHLRDVIERIVDDGHPAYARNVYEAARALFAFAVDRDLIEYNPCDRLKPKNLIGKKRIRERVLSDDELRALWRASGRLCYPYGPLYQFLLLTGARLNEAAGARWREFDFERKIWTIPSERFKSGQQHQVPLTGDALALLGRCRTSVEVTVYSLRCRSVRSP